MSRMRRDLACQCTAGRCPKCLVGAAVSKSVTHRQAARPEATGPPASGGVVDLAEFQRSIVENGLIEAEELARFVVRPDEVSRLAGALIRAGRLTAYQSAALSQGKAKGLSIGDYLVLDKLGQGGMGVVFKARHRPTGQVVAMKILPPSFGRDREAVQRFRREVEIASRLDHPNVVAALDASEVRGVHFLAMEYISGYDLDRLVTDGGPLPVELALHCTIHAARGLAAAHAQGIIHRDVKPGNVMLDDRGSVRVLDLGLARVVEADNLIGGSPVGSLTRSGAYMGTVDFMAPEQADDPRQIDRRADIYSLGCTLYFLLTGRPPFLGDTVLKRLMAHQERPAPSLRAARPELSEKLEAAYLEMMAKRPAERPNFMADVVDLLEACRSSPDNEEDARADLTTFAKRAFKRAVPRGRDRGPDASIFARRPKTEGAQFDPDLRFEDVVMNLREESHPEPLSEEKLPPIVSRRIPKRVHRRRSSVPYALIGLVLTGLIAAGYAFRSQPKEDGRDPAQRGTVTSPTADESSPASPALGAFVMVADPVVSKRPTLTAPYRPTSPVADGVIRPGEYGAGVEVDFSEASRFGVLKAGMGNPALSKTPEDLSVQLQAAYSDQSLFLAFRVRDQFIDAPAVDQPNPHFNDCVEVFLDGDHVANDFNANNESKTGSSEGFQLLTDAAGHQLTVSDDFTNRDWKAATARTGDGYVVELEIPLSLIDTQDGPGKTPAGPSSLIHLGMAIDDYDEKVGKKRAFAYLRADEDVLSPYLGREGSWTMGIKLAGGDEQAAASSGHSPRPRTALENTIGMTLRLIPGGTFLMGTRDSEEDEDAERPQHRVTISRPFYLGIYEVTQAEYAKVMGVNPSNFRASERNPVEMVSWYDAVKFCNRLSQREMRKPYYRIEGDAVAVLGGAGYRLPTEAEWEYACRAGTATRFAFGDDAARIGDFAWTNQNSGGKPHPVGQKAPNPWGLYDMPGNVVEWCQDFFADDYYKKSPNIDPPGATSADTRAARGNSVNYDPEICRPAARGWLWPTNQRPDHGFRVACGVS